MHIAASKVVSRACLLIAAAVTLLAQSTPPDAAGAQFFETKIRPVLANRCYVCHGVMAPKPKGGLRLDSREGLRKGGNSGSPIVAGDPDASLLIKALRYTDPNLKMPPGKSLAPEVVADFERRRLAVRGRAGGQVLYSINDTPDGQIESNGPRSVAVRDNEMGAGQDCADNLALHSNAAAVNDADGAEALLVRLLQIGLDHPLYVARRHAVQVEDIGKRNTDRFAGIFEIGWHNTR